MSVGQRRTSAGRSRGGHYIYRWIWITAAMALFSGSTAAQQTVLKKLTLSQVERLISHHVPDATLEIAIERHGLAFTPTPATIAALRTEGAGPLTLAAFAHLLPVPSREVSGTVIDETTGRPDTGDTAVLLSPTQGMQEVASSKLDAQGHFWFIVTDNNHHLIRVDHQQVSYYKVVPPGTTHVDVTVYDVAAQLPGVRTEADVLRLQTDSQGLDVIENYFVKNDSKQPKTQFGSEAYPIYLPANAQIEGAQAEGPDGMPISISPVPLAGKGHYAFVYPLRPGETRFAINYLVPYSGSMTFHPQVSLPTGAYAVMLPNSMTFQSPGASGLAQIHDNKVHAQTFVSRNVKPGQSLTFTVSGTGSMPRGLQAK